MSDENNPLGSTVTEQSIRDAAAHGDFGRYVLRQKLGEGGMGEVWIADQTEPVFRKVALKIIKTGMDTRQVLARFEAERQALAMMDHPNIARVFDGGVVGGEVTTAPHRPFFVMELVHGEPLTRYCDSAKLSVRTRLELFVAICRAVQHAHQKGIIHRDLKPANILVTTVDGKPLPKIIDFGVAKAVGGKLLGDSLATQFGAVVGTLEYMAPEQARFTGDDIDTRADIYALGVILYELLIGMRPFDSTRLQQAAFDEAIRIIREEEPSKPSTRLSTAESSPSIAAVRQTEPRRLANLLRGDLDWIAMKCLEKDRSRRYETANQLALEIQRHLADEPVQAGPPSAAYRMRKFVRRHRVEVAAAIVVLLALTGGIVGATWGLLRAEAERQRADERRAEAETARNRAREALDLMTSNVISDALARQSELSREQRKFLTDVVGYYREFAGESGDDEPTRARVADAATRVGTIEERLGRPAQALAAHRQALDIRTELAAEFPAKPRYRQLAGNSLNYVAVLLGILGKRAEAEATHVQALELREKLVADFPDAAEHRNDLASTLNNLSLVWIALGKRAEAETACRRALDNREKLVAEFPGVAEFRRDLAISLNNLGIILDVPGQRAEAEAAYRRALAIREKLVTQFPSDATHRLTLAQSLNNLGALVFQLGKYQDAETAYRQTLSVRAKIAEDFPGSPDYRLELARSHFNLGLLLSNSGQKAPAEDAYRQALAIEEKLVADYPSAPEYRRRLAATNHSLASVQITVGKSAECEATLRKATALFERLAEQYPALPDYIDELANCYTTWANLHSSRRRGQDAVAACRQSIAVREKLVSRFPGQPRHRTDLAKSHNNLGILLNDLDKKSEAEAAHRQALANFEKLATDFPDEPTYRYNVAVSRNNLAVLLADLGQDADAEPAYRATLTVCEKLVLDFPDIPKYRMELANVSSNLSLLLSRAKRFADAEPLADRAVTLLAAIVAAEPRLATARGYLRNSHDARGKARIGLKNLADAAADFRAVIELTPASARTNYTISAADTLVRAGDHAVAARLVEPLIADGKMSAGALYNLACVFSLCASAAKMDLANATKLADRAMATLSAAIAAGWTDAAHMARDDDLAILRERSDFKKLLADLKARTANPLPARASGSRE